MNYKFPLWNWPCYFSGWSASVMETVNNKIYWSNWSTFLHNYFTLKHETQCCVVFTLQYKSGDMRILPIMEPQKNSLEFCLYTNTCLLKMFLRSIIFTGHNTAVMICATKSCCSFCICYFLRYVMPWHTICFAALIMCSFFPFYVLITVTEVIPFSAQSTTWFYWSATHPTTGGHSYISVILILAIRSHVLSLQWLQ
jgi:hypothetical protein